MTDTTNSGRIASCNHFHFHKNFDWEMMTQTVHNSDGTDFDTEKHWSCSLDQTDTGSD